MCMPGIYRKDIFNRTLHVPYHAYEVYVGFLAIFTGGGGPSASGYGGLVGSLVLIGKVYCLPSTCIGVLGGTGGPEVEPDDTRCRG